MVAWSRVAAFLFLSLSFSEWVVADDIPTQLGKRSRLLLAEEFSDNDVLKAWTGNAGRREIADGALRVNQLAADNHAAAFRYPLPVRNCAVQFDFEFHNVKFMHFGYDPAPGELKKKGHLFSVVITPESWSLIEHNDKANPSSTAKTHAKETIKLHSGERYRLLIETKDERITATLAGIGSLQATSADFAVKKPGLVFRVGGKEDEFVQFDNVRVWELK